MMTDWSGSAPPIVAVIVGTYVTLALLYLLGCAYTSRR